MTTTFLEDMYEKLRRPTESGRYAERGPNDDFNEGVDAALDAIAEILGYEYGRITKTQWAHSRFDYPSVTILSDTEGNIEYQKSLGYMIVRRLKAGRWEKAE